MRISDWSSDVCSSDLVAAKHESAYETIALIGLLNEPVIVLKAELAAIPLWGWLARRYGMIPVDREGNTRALRAMLKSANAARDSGHPVAIFPEGTRVPTGETKLEEQSSALQSLMHIK